MNWRQLSTQQRIDAVKAIFKPGMSAAQIAAALPYDMSRNAIIGLIHRHGHKIDGVHFRAPPPKVSRNGGRPRKARGGPAATSKLWAIRTAPIPPSIAMMPRDVGIPAPEPRNLTLMELGPRSCRWCVNDTEPGKGGHLFCGEITEPLKPYCAYHTALSVGAGSPRERAADDVLKHAA